MGPCAYEPQKWPDFFATLNVWYGPPDGSTYLPEAGLGSPFLFNFAESQIEEEGLAETYIRGYL